MTSDPSDAQGGRLFLELAVAGQLTDFIRGALVGG